jgi:hypothetical protein
MAGRIFIFIILLASFNLKCFPQYISNDDSLRTILARYGQVKVKIPYSNRETINYLTREVSILSVRDNEINVCLSPLTIEWFIRQKFGYKIEKPDPPKVDLSALNVKQVFEWDKYPAYSQYDSIMQSFAGNYPELCRLDTIGTSINGRLILVLKISDNPHIDEDEPEVFYTSTMHGDETGGFVLMLRLIHYLLDNYSIDNRVRNLVDNLAIWINPLSNPDGTYRNGDIISSPVRFNANGYDLNRNFPDPVIQSGVMQKETIDMIAFMRERRFVISANFHSGAEVINYPWDRWLSRYHADGSWFNSISRAYADTVHIYAPSDYMTDFDNGVTRGSEWYVIFGGRQDFVTYELQGREVTIELDNEYITSPSRLPLLWEYNRRSLLRYLENALYGIQGYVLDADTFEPVRARVFIAGHDKDSSHIYSGTETGSFVRLLSPGIRDLTFSAPGYYNKLVPGISVSPEYRTELTVYLDPVKSNVDTINPQVPLLYPNPAKADIIAILPYDIAGGVNIKIYSSTGMLVTDYITEIYQGVPEKINVSRLSAGAYQVIFINKDKNISYRGRFILIK